MSFRDFNEDGPGTVQWDIVMGQNTTGLFSDETHYVLEGDQLTEVTFTHTGGGSLEPSLYGLCWTVENIGPVHEGVSQDWFTFEQDGIKYKAVTCKNFKQSRDCYIVDIEQI